MDIPVNLEETPGKTIGRRRPSADGLNAITSSKASAEQWQEAMKTGRIPKGLYRFTSHEEADEWLWKMLTRPRKES